jgi:hypothetical protein
MLRWRDYLHVLPVVRELLAAVEANNVGTCGRFPFGRSRSWFPGSDRESAMMVRTAEQRSDEPEHFSPLWRVFLPSVACMLDEIQLRVTKKIREGITRVPDGRGFWALTSLGWPPD